jgi:hypothetical protein
LKPRRLEHVALKWEPVQSFSTCEIRLLERASQIRFGETRSRVRIHNQNMTTAAKAHADRKTLGHLS